jgi:cytochrome c peroxidase
MTMQKRIVIAMLVAAAGCGKKEEAGEKKPAGGTTTTKKQEPAANRPSQGTLPTLPELVLPDDPKRTEKIALGHALFFEKRLSGDGSLACINCHENADGNGGHDPKAKGVGGDLPRHAPTMWNVAYFKGSFAWDGRLADLQAQAKGALVGKTFHVGEDKLEAKAQEIAALPGYKPLFEAAYGKEAPTFAQIAAALEAYEQTLICKDTAYDKFAGGDKTAMTEPQQRGLDVFMGKGMCTACHAPPYFTTAAGVDGGVYFNVGIGTKDVPEDQVDKGRAAVTNKPEDWAAFKPPTLRNVAKSAPYFHDGSAPTLDDALKVMTTGGIPNKNLTAVMADRKLTTEELADLKAFLSALDCPGTIDPPASK